MRMALVSDLFYRWADEAYDTKQERLRAAEKSGDTTGAKMLDGAADPSHVQPQQLGVSQQTSVSVSPGTDDGAAIDEMQDVTEVQISTAQTKEIEQTKSTEEDMPPAHSKDINSPEISPDLPTEAEPPITGVG